jgi:streptomycin 6-kinase
VSAAGRIVTRVSQPFVVPSHLRESTEVGGPEREDWLRGLPGVVDDLCRRWQLSLEAPYEPGGNCSWVAPGVDAEGREIALKVAWVHSESRDEAEGLTLLAGDGAVAIYAYEHVDEATVAMLLERCRPGTELRALPEHEQDLVIAELLRRICSTPLPANHPFRPLSDLADEWTVRAEALLAEAPGRVDAGLAREGFAQFRELAGTGPGPVLLWTDLHAGNVLSGTRHPWQMIDPKPYVGDPHYDVLQHVINCPDRLIADPFGLIARIADLTDLDPDRIVAWMKARSVVEAAAATSPWQDFAGFWSALSDGASLSGT